MDAEKEFVFLLQKHPYLRELVSSKHKFAILKTLETGPKTPAEISGETSLLLDFVEKTLTEFFLNDLVQKQGDRFSLTEHGLHFLRIYEEVKKHM